MSSAVDGAPNSDGVALRASSSAALALVASTSAGVALPPFSSAGVALVASNSAGVAPKASSSGASSPIAAAPTTSTYVTVSPGPALVSWKAFAPPASVCGRCCGSLCVVGGTRGWTGVFSAPSSLTKACEAGQNSV